MFDNYRLVVVRVMPEMEKVTFSCYNNVIMSQYYNARKTKGLFDPAKNGPGKEPFKLSRSKIDLFLECRRCFYFDRRLGVARPPGYPFNLNSAVDTLLKKEFDIHRANGNAHPLMRTYKIDAVPMKNDNIEKWRNNLQGVAHVHEPTNFRVFGAIDDVWVNPSGELHIVDYKATSKNANITLDAPWQDSYKRQMEVYQWLFRKNSFTVSDIGYFVYANALRDRKAFDAVLEFDVQVISYTGSDSWIEKTLADALSCLNLSLPPKASEECDFCSYRRAVGQVVSNARAKNNK